jgi:hypothetical protein
MTPGLTTHATRRANERAIPSLVISLLIEYGVQTRSKGAWSYSLDKTARRRLRSSIGSVAYKRLADLFDSYVVVADSGEVITAAWRIHRLKKQAKYHAALH